MNRYLLDTNILLAYVRGHELYKTIEKELELTNPENNILISIVSKAEILSLGIQNNWGEKKLKGLNIILNRILIVNINDSDSNLINAYIQIDAFSQGKLTEKTLNVSARNMGKNDLWIAATAKVTNSTLITTDNDFNHLDPDFIKVIKF